MSAAIPPTPQASEGGNLSLGRPIDPAPLLDLKLPHDYNLVEDFLGKALENWSDRVAMVSNGEVFTFGQFARMINACGNVLLNNGVSIEQRILLIMDNSVYLAATFLAAIKIGAIPVTLSKAFLPHEFRYLFNDSRAGLAVVDPDIFPLVKELLPDHRYLRKVILTQPVPSAINKSLTEELLDAPTELEAAATTADDVAFWVYTSGATGFPKASMHMHHSPVYCCEAFANAILSINEDDVILSLAPMTGSQGIINSIFFPLYSGATTVLLPTEASPEEIIRVINTHRPTILFATPEQYQSILVEALKSDVTLPSLSSCYASGHTLSPALEANWKSHFDIDILNGLGATEVLYTFITNTVHEQRTGSVGKVVPGYEIRIEDNNGNTVPPGVIGDLFVRGSSIALGYRNRYTRSCSSFIGSWFRTGDKCSQDEQGFIFFAGRREDMIQVREQWVVPMEIERHLLEQKQIAQAAVVGSLDDEGQVRLKAYLVLQPNLDPTAELSNTLRILANEGQAPAKQIKWVEFVPKLPRSSNGRLQRYKLR